MKPKQNRIYLLLLGILVALSLTALNLKPIGLTATESETDMLSKYKSSIPLVTTPLQILAKGLKIVNKK